MSQNQDPLDRLLRCAAQASEPLPSPGAAVANRVLAAIRAGKQANPLQELIPMLRIGLGFAIACFVAAAILGSRQMSEIETAEDHGITLGTTTIAWVR